MFSGSLVALATPFHNQAPDLDALTRMVHWHREQGTQGIVILGTTGEASTVSMAESRTILCNAVEAAGGQLPIIFGATSNNPTEAIELAQIGADCGADALLCAAGYYNRPSQEGLYRHFEMLHAHTDLPMLIYNIPPRCQVDILPETMARLAELPRVIGVKDATKDLSRITQERQKISKPFSYLSGEDMTAPAYNAQGGRGCISVTANVAPRLCAQMQAACERGDFYQALEIHERLAPLHLALSLEPNPAGVKYALSVLGLCQNELRLPMVPVSEETRRAIERAIESLAL